MFFLVQTRYSTAVSCGLLVAFLVGSLKWCFECISKGCDFVFMFVCIFEFEQLIWSEGKLFSLVIILSFSNCFIFLGTLVSPYNVKLPLVLDTCYALATRISLNDTACTN